MRVRLKDLWGEIPVKKNFFPWLWSTLRKTMRVLRS